MVLPGAQVPYMAPLFLVFWAEYACQSGAWTAFAYPEPALLHEAEARRRAYEAYNLLYQCGVFASRASVPDWKRTECALMFPDMAVQGS